jgi:hypothetical protein
MVLLLFLSGCNNNTTNIKDADEPKNIADVDPRSIWFDYQVWGEESDDSVTVKLQYRFRKAGPTLLLNEPAKVELDGKPIPGNSSKITGPYYELRYPVSTFKGDHSIVFTDVKGKQYKATFSFKSFSLDPADFADKFPDVTLILNPKGVAPGDLIRVLLTDTSFANNDVDRMDTINGKGELIITEKDMKQLAKGPVQMELIKEEERPVQNGIFESGRIRVSYGLRREFLLLSIFNNPNNY